MSILIEAFLLDILPSINGEGNIKEEYPQAKAAVVVCRVPYPHKLQDNITAIPWQEWQHYLEAHYPSQ